LGRGDIAEAERAFQEAIQKTPARPEPWYFLGAIDLQRGEEEKAIERFQKVLKLAPNHLLSTYNIGLAYLRLGKRDEAIPFFQKAVEIQPAFYPAYLELGRLYESQGRVEEAVSAFNAVIQHGGSAPEAQEMVKQARERLAQTGDTPEKARQASELFKRGQTYLEKNQIKEAQADFEEILKIVPDNAVARYMLARVELDKGNIFQATRLLEQAVKIDLNAWQIYYLLGQLYESQGRWSEATLVYLVVSKIVTEGPVNQDVRSRLAMLKALLEEQKLRESIRTDIPLVQARQKFEAGIAALQQGKTSESIDLISEAVRLDSTNPFYHYNLGIAYFSETKLVEAAKVLQNAIGLKKDYGPAHFFLGQIYASSGDAAMEGGDVVGAGQEYQKSIGELESTLQYGAEQWQLDGAKEKISALNKVIGKIQEGSGHTILGSTLGDRKDKEGALREFKLASELLPQDPFSRLSMGVIYEEQGEIAKAVQSYEEAAKASPLNPNPYLYLGRLYENQKQVEEAVKAYNTAIEKNPKFPEPVIRLGTLYFEQNKFDEAKTQYLKAIQLDPQQPEPHFYLGQIYEKEEKEREAVEEYKIAQTLIPPEQDIAKYVQDRLAALDRFSARWSHAFFNYNDNVGAVQNNPTSEIYSNFSFGLGYIALRTQRLHRLLPIPLTVPIDVSSNTGVRLNASFLSNSENVSLSLQTFFGTSYDLGVRYSFAYNLTDELPISMTHIWSVTGRRTGKIPSQVSIGATWLSVVDLTESSADSFNESLDISTSQSLEKYGSVNLSYSYSMVNTPRLDQDRRSHALSFGYSRSLFRNLSINGGVDYEYLEFQFPRVLVSPSRGNIVETLQETNNTFTLRLSTSYPLGNGLLFSASYIRIINQSNLGIPRPPVNDVERQFLGIRPTDDYQQNVISLSIGKSF
jgi:tetratricopeptide (TPR) repeat protein